MLKKSPPRIRWERLPKPDKHGNKYVALNTVRYYSPRYNKYVVVEIGDRSDGATGPFVTDVFSDAWGFHDKLCRTGMWDDGTPVTAWQAASVLGDVLWRDGHYFRAYPWKFTTFLFGCDRAKANGWF